MERWVAKIIALFIILIVPGICTIIPYKVSDYVAKKGAMGVKVLSCLMCFGGGVFFATYILHMGPEVRTILDEALIKPNNITYPVADVIMAAGFFLVFFAEKITLKLNKRRQKLKLQARKEKCIQVKKVVKSDCDCECNGSCETKNGVLPEQKKKKAVSIEDLALNLQSCPLSGTGDCCSDPEEAKTPGTDDHLFMVYTPHEAEDEATVSAHSTRSLVLILALSLHRIFEGMSVGLQQTSANVWSLLLAVMCHETVIGFSMGLQFVKNGFKLKRMLVASILCSCIMPLGVIIGMVIVEVGQEGPALNILNGVLQGIATGTFIYVTFFEILQEEIDAHDTSLSKVISVFVGFALMALLSAVPEEDPTLLAAHLATNATAASASPLG
eukprot:GHVO01047023.1.p1 GENE.GHVO01047023.1~~GHVO01047023.1.p1  ORF type:complete len:385 (+),score=59.61 GHVO01047023.1:41-1195(+)